MKEVLAKGLQGMLLVQMLHSLLVVIWERVNLKTALGQELTKTLVEECITDFIFKTDGMALPDLHRKDR